MTHQPPSAVGRRHLLGVSISAAGAIALSACGNPNRKAGQPGEHEAILRSAGVGTFLYSGCDALAILMAALVLIGAA